MKKLLLFSSFSVLLITNSYTQGVAINNDGSLPNPNAMLHVLNARASGVGSAGLFEKAAPYFNLAGYTTEPNSELEVRCMIGAITGMTGLRIMNKTVPNLYAWTLYTQNSDGAFVLYANGLTKGRFDAGTGAYTALSDSRVKSAVVSMPNILSSVMKLTPKTYYYTSDANRKKQFGFIAQDVEDLFPHIVYKHKSDNGADELYTMDYSGFGVIAIKAIQEQQQIIEKQNNDIETLKSQVAELTKAVRALTNK